MMKAALLSAVTGMILVAVMAMTAFSAPVSAPAPNRVSIRYVPPNNPSHQQIYTELKQHNALEKLQKFLSPYRLPGKLRISLDECDGEPDAFYERASITICYEYIDELLENMPQETTTAGVAPIDTIIGPLFEVSLHEFAHALFDMLELPVFGREVVRRSREQRLFTDSASRILR